MRIIIQRVSEASVLIDGVDKRSIDSGMVILLGIEPEDHEEDADWLCGKIAKLRIFNDAEGVMNLSLEETHGQVLLISQFTLFASTKKGNRPSYIRAARPEVAIPLYEYFIQQLNSITGKKCVTGTFGADMKVALVNDGPVTIFIDSKLKE